MSPVGKDLAVGLALAALALPLWAAPPYHALEVEPPNAVLFVDAERSRLLRFDGSRLTVMADLSDLPNGSHLHNLVRGADGALYLGDRRGTWRVDGPGSPEPAAPPEALRPLFSRRPAALAPDGSIYLAADFKHLERALPGGDTHPVPSERSFRRIETLTVSVRGDLFVSDLSRVFRLDSRGVLERVFEADGQTVLGLAAGSAAELLLLLASGEELSLVRLHSSGERQVLLTPAQIAAAPTTVTTPE